MLNYWMECAINGYSGFDKNNGGERWLAWNENKPARGCIVTQLEKQTRVPLSALARSTMPKVRSVGNRRPFACAASEQPDNGALTL